MSFYLLVIIFPTLFYPPTLKGITYSVSVFPWEVEFESNGSIISLDELILNLHPQLLSFLRLLFQLEVFQHGLSLRIGFKDVFLFARYNLSNTFLSSNTQRDNLFSFGISLGG